jgi:hypothetical protein
VSDQPEQQVPAAQTPQEPRQSTPGQPEVSKKAVEELSDAEVKTVTGGYMLGGPLDPPGPGRAQEPTQLDPPGPGRAHKTHVRLKPAGAGTALPREVGGLGPMGLRELP